MADNLALSLETLGVKLPYSMQAEQAVLGAAIIDNTVVATMVERLKPEYFYAKQNGEIFAAIVGLFLASTPVDFVTLTSKVIDAGVFPDPQSAKVYMTDIAETVPGTTNISNYINIVEEKYLIRTVMNAAKQILEQSSEEQNAKVLLEFAEQKIYEIRRGRDQSALQPIKSVIVDTLQHLQQISGPDRDKYAGVPCGFTQLDRILTGLGKSDLIILAARPGMGKTSFALNIATNVAKKAKIPVAVFSLEMTRDQLVTRMLSSEAGIDSQSLRIGSLSGDDWDDLARTSEILAGTPIYLDDTSNITISEIKAKVRRVDQDPNKTDIGLIIIDYLQLMNSGNKTSSRVQ
ncbi:MAG: replicative DNA helicase, partial [Oscillospiraceae bacterium]